MFKHKIEYNNYIRQKKPYGSKIVRSITNIVIFILLYLILLIPSVTFFAPTIRHYLGLDDNRYIDIHIERGKSLYGLDNSLASIFSLNPILLENISSIYFTQEPNLDSPPDAFDGNTVGEYSQLIPHNIWFFSQFSSLSAYHEVGHNIYQNILNSTQRKLWNDISNSSSIFVTGYAKTNANEDFAESFSYYMGYHYCSDYPSDLEKQYCIYPKSTSIDNKIRCLKGKQATYACYNHVSLIPPKVDFFIVLDRKIGGFEL